jgi:hypothetical protein
MTDKDKRLLAEIGFWTLIFILFVIGVYVFFPESSGQSCVEDNKVERCVLTTDGWVPDVVERK